MLYSSKCLTLSFALVLLAMVLCAPAAYGQSNTQDYQISNQLLTNTCNGETVVMNGTVHQEMSFSTNPNGMTHFSFNFSVHLSGVGQTTGVSYVANDGMHTEVNVRGFAQEQSFGTKTKLIAQGPVPNMTDRITLHVVTDQNGAAKIDVSKEVLSCN